uniref:P2X purinoceptor n=1 Tax=Microcebus murinus TaxID=30608 RepID=A0A8C5W9J6_MICMU
MGPRGWKELFLSLFDYKTEKYVVAKNKKVGLLYRLLQFFILTYLVVWVFIIKKGYQDVDTSLQSAVVTKVKGVAFTNTSALGARLWDVADYVIPAQREDIPDGLCSEDSDCHPGEAVIAGHGVKTGRCLRAGDQARGTCEIFAWCPLETKSEPEVGPRIREAHPHLPGCAWPPPRSNVMDIKDKSFLKFCHFGPENHYCPIFRLGSVIRWAGSSFQELALKGGVIGIRIEWNCDLDKAASECNPHYSFSRLDNKPAKSVSSGYNFRFARYYRDQAGVEFRTLLKAYGIRFDVMVNGKGAFFCDLVLIYLIKKSGFYRDKKYEEVRSAEEEEEEEEEEEPGLGLSEQPVSESGLQEQPEQPKAQHGSLDLKGNSYVSPQRLEPSR